MKLNIKYVILSGTLSLILSAIIFPLISGPKIRLNSGWNRDIVIEGTPSDVYIPKKYKKKNLLLLPGWNYSKSSWIENTKMIEFADRYGYALIMPDMKITLYESEYFPETKMKWNTIPGGKYIKNYFIPEMQNKYGLLTQKQKNFLLGLSTGGRGVALVSLENPGIFTAGASLSGDFSQENMPGDRIMTNVYGSYQQFRERWTGRDNPMARISEWKMHIYLSHGADDRIVPPIQTKLFHDRLVKSGKDIKIIYHKVPGKAHNYAFWGDELDKVFDFFNQF